jgi:predicted Na+-dependent transporter
MNSDGSLGALGFGLLFVCIPIAVFEIVAFWKVFEKAGQPGWAVLVPFYNGYVILKIAGKPGWWLLLYLIPLVNFVIAILVMIDFAKAFGKGTGFALGLVFLSGIFIPILGFGDATYRGAPA